MLNTSVWLQQKSCEAVEKIFGKLNAFFRGKWRLAVLDLESGRWTVPPKLSNLPYLKYQNACGRHILMQPVHQANYLLVDDIDQSVIRRHHQYSNGQWKPGRMVVETSPQNFQTWIYSSRPLSLNEKRYWLNKLHNDPGADPNNRWGRCPGFRNRKEKYQNSYGHFPLSRLIWVDWEKQADIPFQKIVKKTFSHLPQGGLVCRFNSIFRSNYEKGNDSVTDFSYALALARRGYSTEEIKKRILTERSNWKNHCTERKKQFYLEKTVRKAIGIVLAS